PERPSFCAAHRPRNLLRRAFALNRSSSSRANCFSKPSSRLSNVVMPASLFRERPAAAIGSQPFGREARRAILERFQHPALDPRAPLHRRAPSSRQLTAKWVAPGGARATQPLGGIAVRSPTV